MTTVAILIERVRRQVLAGHRPQVNVLAADASSGATTLTMSMGLDAIAASTLLDIENEIFYVTSVNRSAGTVQVLPSMFGTSPAAHVTGTLVYVNQRFHSADIFDTMLEEIRSWPTNVYRIGTVDLTYASGVRGYDLIGIPSDYTSVLRVLRAPEAQPSGLPNSNSWARIPFREERSLNAADFPSGAAVFLEKEHPSLTKFRAIYNRPFNTTTWAMTTDLEATCLVPTTLLDCLKYGCMWRLASTGETARTDPSSDSDTREDQAIPAGMNIRNAMVLKQLRDTRLNEEADRLRDMWKLPVI